MAPSFKHFVLLTAFVCTGLLPDVLAQKLVYTTVSTEEEYPQEGKNGYRPMSYLKSAQIKVGKEKLVFSRVSGDFSTWSVAGLSIGAKIAVKTPGQWDEWSYVYGDKTISISAACNEEEWFERPVWRISDGKTTLLMRTNEPDMLSSFYVLDNEEDLDCEALAQSYEEPEEAKLWADYHSKKEGKWTIIFTSRGAKMPDHFRLATTFTAMISLTIREYQRAHSANIETEEEEDTPPAEEEEEKPKKK